MEGPVSQSTEIPVYLQALLNIIAFLIAAVAMWYAYFVKAHDRLEEGGGSTAQQQVAAYPPELFSENTKSIVALNHNLGRMADSAEKIYELMKHDSDEAEIQRRVKMQLMADRKKVKGEYDQ